MSFEAHNLTVPSIAWLGLLPSDIERWERMCQDGGCITKSSLDALHIVRHVVLFQVTRPGRSSHPVICRGPKKAAESTEEAVRVLPAAVEARGA